MRKEPESLKKCVNLIIRFLESNACTAQFNDNPPVGFDGVVFVPEIEMSLLIKAKRKIHTSDLPRLEPFKKQIRKNENLIIATEKLTKGTFDECVKKDIFIIDTCGNGRFRIGMCFYERFIATESATKLPVSGTPFSAKATRLVRAFLASPTTRAWTQGELARAANISQSYASKRLALLKTKGYITSIANVFKLEEPERLLEGWQAHYRFDRHRKYQYALSFSTYDNGLNKLAEELDKLKIEFTFTGWSGSHLRAPYGTSNQLMAYVSTIPEENRSNVLFPVKDKGNVVLYLPQDEGIFQFNQKIRDLPVVSDAQLYLDLKKMPGRASEQAEALKEKYLRFDK